MSDFLQFLNTADQDTLTQIPGITRTTAANIIAARPFDFVEDCAKVRGMGKNLLGRAQSYFEEQLNDSRNRALVPVEEEALPIMIAGSQTAGENLEDEPSFWSKLGKALLNFLKALVRLVMIVALIVVIGAAFYYGLPYINRTFIAPVEKNTAQIDRLEADITALQTQLDETKNRVTALETSVEVHTASIEKLAGIQASLEVQLEDNNDKALLGLKHQVMVTRALDMLGRGRLYLAQSNFGLAKEDIQAARDLLAQLQSETGDEVLGQVVSRLDLALSNLPEFPVVASGDLEIAWQVLISGKAASTPPPAIFTPTFVVDIATPTPLPPTQVPSLTPTP